MKKLKMKRKVMKKNNLKDRSLSRNTWALSPFKLLYLKGVI